MENIVNYLRCNYLEKPLGIDSDLRFTWELTSPVDQSITGFSLGISSDLEKAELNQFDVFDSGIKSEAEILDLVVKSSSLSPCIRYYWRLTVYFQEQEPAVSAVAYFETGMLGRIWKGRWISKSFDKSKESAERSPYLRKAFSLQSGIESARLYICGLGYFEAYINGKRVGTDELSTPFTNYDKRILYRTFDVTELLQAGDNAMGVVLGNGWYNCIVDDPWNTSTASWKHFAKLLAELHVRYENGESAILQTDASWKSSEGPIRMNNIRNGVFYDARCEMEGWNELQFDDSAWEAAKLSRAPGGILMGSEIEPIRITREIPAKKKWLDKDGNWVIDLGENFAGICRFTLKGKAESEITFKYNEELLADGITVDQAKNANFIRSGEFQTDKYIKRSDDSEVFQPSFIYHGFRYVTIIGLDYEPCLEDVTGLFMHTDFEKIGEFSCDVALINKIYDLCIQSTLSNHYGILTDCPHREKNAWTGDASVSSEQLMIHFNAAAAQRKWAYDLVDAQKPNGNIPCVVPSTGWGYYGLNGPDWSSAMHMIPWTHYLYTGDKGLLSELLEPMRKHVDYDAQMANDHILHYGLGDWCAPFEGPSLFVNMSKFKCPSTVSDTAFYYWSTFVVAKAAEILEKPEMAKEYYARAQQIKEAFRKRFFDKDTGIVEGNCQTSTALFLCMGLYEAGEEDLLMKRLEEQFEAENGHLDFGLIGCKYVPEMLGRMGRPDILVKMLQQTDYPSFGKWINEGATTLWECWNSTGSHNHHMFSSVSAFMYKYLAGICIDEESPGFKHFFFCPGLKSGLNECSASYHSIRGQIAISWKKSEDSYYIDLEVPANTSASFMKPSSMKLVKIHKVLDTEKGTNVGNQCIDQSTSGLFDCIPLNSGRYHLIVKS